MALDLKSTMNSWLDFGVETEIDFLLQSIFPFTNAGTPNPPERKIPLSVHSGGVLVVRMRGAPGKDDAGSASTTAVEPWAGVRDANTRASPLGDQEYLSGSSVQPRSLV